jgi:hypothetical protein
VASNHKLTALIAGRTISGTGNANGALTVQFSDGSSMLVKTRGSSNSASTGGKVKAVRQAGTTLDLDFESGDTLAIPLAEATSSVLVRDVSGDLEYAD